MGLTNRFSALFLSALGLILLGFSTTLYLSAHIYLHRQAKERLSSALAVLAAAAEIHADSVEWEPQERALPLGQESGNERLRWLVFDERGVRVDHSRNLVESELTPAWTPQKGTVRLPDRLSDRQGRVWGIAQRRLLPSTPRATGSRAAAINERPRPPDPADAVYPSLVLTVAAPLEPIRATLATLFAFLALLSLGIWLLAALVCRRFSKQALRPLTQMAASARSLDASDLGWRLEETRTGDELEELGDAFNNLLSRLHLAYEQQRRFSSHASHQLRTPLTVLIGQLEVALRHERSGEEYRRALRSALGRAVQLGQIVETLLFLARADADARIPGRETLQLDSWLTAHLACRGTSVRGSDIEYRPPAESPLWIQSHPVLLGQLLDNLLDNAEKYGAPGTPIEVRAFQEGDEVLLEVEDHGQGISPADVSRIFEPFYRSPQARRQGAPGIGLGLAVVQRIASALGGTVEVESELGHGSRFRCRFPAAKASEPTLDSADNPEVLGVPQLPAEDPTHQEQSFSQAVRIENSSPSPSGISTDT